MRAARLDGSLYGEIRSDATATAQALAVVALVSLAHGLGELSFFAAASFVIYFVVRYAFGVTVVYAQVMRPFGFSVLPGLLILVATLASLVGDAFPVFVVLVVWRLAAGFVAVRQASGMGVIKSGVALLVGTLCCMVAMTRRAPVEILGWVGVSS